MLKRCTRLFARRGYRPAALCRVSPCRRHHQWRRKFAQPRGCADGLDTKRPKRRRAFLTGVSANYVRMGNLVFAYATVTWPGTANGANATIGGLSIAAPNLGYVQQCGISWSYVSMLSRMQVIQNSTNIGLYTSAGAGITYASFSGLTVTFTCLYPAT